MAQVAPSLLPPHIAALWTSVMQAMCVNLYQGVRICLPWEGRRPFRPLSGPLPTRSCSQGSSVYPTSSSGMNLCLRSADQGMIAGRPVALSHSEASRELRGKLSCVRTTWKKTNGRSTSPKCTNCGRKIQVPLRIYKERKRDRRRATIVIQGLIHLVYLTSYGKHDFFSPRILRRYLTP